MKIFFNYKTMNVPFIDLRAEHAPLRQEFDRAIGQVIDSAAFAGGKFVKAFEGEFAEFCGCEYAAGVGSGTEALWFALMALGVGPGDEVITVPNTFIATAEAISYCGATPVFVDVDPRTYTMDPAGLLPALTPRTKAIIPVHLFGQMADMDPILDFANAHGLVVIEDSAQAHGATYKGRSAGSLGDAGCFSFYPGKNLGAFGDAGMVVTRSEEVQRKIQMLKDHGQRKKHHHSMIGWNGRMDGIQAAVLSVKLAHLDESNRLRRSHAARYDLLLSDTIGVVVPATGSSREHVHHLYPIRVAPRDRVLESLGKQGIECLIHYPIPLHLQAAYSQLGYSEGDFPVAEHCAREFLSLPLFPALGVQQLEYVAESLKAVLSSQTRVECRGFGEAQTIHSGA